MDETRGIGKNNQLPWKISADLKYFQKVTTDSCEGKQNAVIMGRHTFESIGCRPLKNRLNFVLTSCERSSEYESVRFYKSLKDAVQMCEMNEMIHDIYVIGGQQLYEKACIELPLNGIYITAIRGNYHCDRFFPTLEGYQKVWESEDQEEKGIIYSYQYWTKTNCE